MSHKCIDTVYFLIPINSERRACQKLHVQPSRDKIFISSSAIQRNKKKRKKKKKGRKSTKFAGKLIPQGNAIEMWARY